MHPAYFADQWARYRKRQRMFYLSWPSSAALAIVGGWLAEALDVPGIFVAFAVVAVALPVMATNYVIAFPCPRCGKTFANARFWRNPFARKCVHCGTAVGDGP